MEWKCPWLTEEIYNDFDESKWRLDIQTLGNNTCELFPKAIQAIKPRIIIEIGSWKGASAIRCAKLSKKYRTKIICVDTWLGTVNNFLKKDGLPENSMMRRHGYPHLYYQFLANVVKTKNTKRIYPLIQTSNNAYAVLSHYKVIAGIIYIDASHEFNDVYNDLNNYWNILTDNGIIIGDDLERKGVKQALELFTIEKDLNAYLSKGTNKFIVFKKEPKGVVNSLTFGKLLKIIFT